MDRSTFALRQFSPDLRTILVEYEHLERLVDGEPIEIENVLLVPITALKPDPQDEAGNGAR